MWLKNLRNLPMNVYSNTVLSKFCIHFNILCLTVLLYIYDMTRHYCIVFFEYLSEDGRERPKHVGGIPHVCTPLYLIAVQVLVYIYIYIYMCVCVCVCVCVYIYIYFYCMEHG